MASLAIRFVHIVLVSSLIPQLIEYARQFGGQEPGEDADIASFCELNHGVNFPLMKKSDVNGDNANDVYKYLKGQKSGLLGLTRIKVSIFDLECFRPTDADSPSVELREIPDRQGGQSRSPLGIDHLTRSHRCRGG